MTRAGLARLSAAFVASVCLSGLVASAQSGSRYSAALVPDEEVPAVSSKDASGKIVLDIDETGEEIRYELTYSGLQGNVAQAHIHFGQPAVTGSIILWLCQATATPAPALGINPPTCPQSGSVSGVLKPSDVIAAGTTSQLILAGEFDEAVAFIRKGLAYANVHTNVSPGGEIRGQIGTGGGHK